MSDQKIFIETWGPYLEKEGYIRKGNAFYHCLPEAQVIKIVRMRNFGEGFYEIIGSIACYADAIDMNGFKHSELYDMDSFIRCFTGKFRSGEGTGIRDLRLMLEEDREKFDQYFMPMMKDVNSVEGCYRFKKYIRNVMNFFIWGCEDLLFDSFQCGFYDETLRHAQELYKIQRRNYWRVKNKRDHVGGFSEERVFQEEENMQRYGEWLEEVRAGVYDRLTDELQGRIDFSRKSCSKFFSWRM